MFGAIAQAITGATSHAIDTGIGLYQNNRARQDAEMYFSKNAQLQRDFAQNGIRWKVEDAKRAGIHPIVALGAQPYNASPAGAPAMQQSLPSFEGMGQSIGRAIEAKATQAERARTAAYNADVQALDIEQRRLTNRNLAADFALTSARAAATAAQNQQQVPPLPSVGKQLGLIPGQTEALPKSDDNLAVSHQPYMEAGHAPDVSLGRTARGYSLNMSDYAKNRTEEDLLGTIAWNVRNRLPFFSDVSSHRPPDSDLRKFGASPRTHVWTFFPSSQEWRPTRKTNYQKFRK